LFKPHVGDGLKLLEKLNTNSTDTEAHDNVVASICRIVEFQFMPMPADQRPAEYGQMIQAVLSKIPLEGDDLENETVLKFVFKLHKEDKNSYMAFIDNIAKTCVKVIIDEKCADGVAMKFRREVAKFIYSVGMNESAEVFTNLANQMSP
jgi:hypothetical protein